MRVVERERIRRGDTLGQSARWALKGYLLDLPNGIPEPAADLAAQKFGCLDVSEVGCEFACCLAILVAHLPIPRAAGKGRKRVGNASKSPVFA